jgi:hypothetical protein
MTKLKDKKDKLTIILTIIYWLIPIIVGIFCIIVWDFVGLAILLSGYFSSWLIGIYHKLHMRIWDLENECKNIRGRITLDRENIESELEVVFDSLSDRINFLSKRLSKIDLTNHVEKVTKDLEKLETTSKKTLFDDIWKIEPPVKK